MYIEVKEACKSFTQKGEELLVLNHINLSIDKGEFICLLGPSGCGKSTLLNAIAGFEQLTEGSIEIDGKLVKEPSTNHVMIFQNYGLLPWRTVQKNVELGLEHKKMSNEQKRVIAEKYIDLVGLSAFKNAHPRQLSGGMQQRVAIARALSVDPDIVFMDEPFGALDAITRMKLQDDILEISRSQNKTVIFVTHDIEEAIFLADRIVILSPHPGRIKSIIKIPLSRGNRDRTSHDFLYWRDKVFEIFNMKHEPNIEYTI